MRFGLQADGDNRTNQAFHAAIDAPVKDKRSFRVLEEDFDRFRANLL